MRKHLTIATISLMAAFLAACPATRGMGPGALIRDEVTPPDLVFENPKETSRQTFTYRVGPYELPAGAIVNKINTETGNLRFSIDEPVWIESFEPAIENSEGGDLPNDLVQSIILVNHNEENSFCTTKQTGNPFAAVTSSMEKVELPEGYGYPIVPTDELEAAVVLKNPTGEDYHGVYIKFVLTGKKMNGANHTVDVRPLMIDIDPCEHSPVSIAPGQFIEKSVEAYSPEAGSIIKAYGLLQDYGVSISMSANGSTEPFWHGIVEIDEDYKITALPPFEDPAGIPIKRGDALKLTVAYDNCSKAWYDEATGAAMVYLARTEEEEPPAGNGDEATSATDVQKALILN